MQVPLDQVYGPKDTAAFVIDESAKESWTDDPAACLSQHMSWLFGTIPRKRAFRWEISATRSEVRKRALEIWVEREEQDKRFASLENWANIQFDYVTKLNELRYRSVTNVRSMLDFGWADQFQQTELHEEDGAAGTPFRRRDNYGLRWRRLGKLLADSKLLDAVLAGTPILVTPLRSAGLKEHLLALAPAVQADLKQILGLVVYADDGSFKKDQVEYQDEEKWAQATWLLRRVLTRCGYVFSGEVSYEKRQRREWWTRTFQVVTPTVLHQENPSELDPGSTSAKGPFSIVSSNLLYRSLIGNPTTKEKTGTLPRLNGSTTQKNFATGVTVWLDPRIDGCLDLTVGDTEDKTRRLRAMADLQQKRTPALGGGWWLDLPGELEWKPRAHSARLYAGLAFNIPNFARPFIYAPPGTRFLSFDFGQAHFRIADKLLRQASPRCTFFADMFTAAEQNHAGDLYAALAARLNEGLTGGLQITRDQAKKCALVLLNGGDAATLVAKCKLPLALAKSTVAAWKKNNKWIDWRIAMWSGRKGDDHAKNSYLSAYLANEEAALLQRAFLEIDNLTRDWALALPLFDGALSICPADKVDQIKLSFELGLRAACVAQGMPGMRVTVGAGETWAESEA
jgi:hypothetical protein